MIRLIALMLIATTWSSLQAADTEAVAKTKAAAEQAFKTAAMKTIVKAESPHVLVYAGWADAKAKPIADACEKAFDVACKNLKVEKPDELFPGKLSIVLTPDRRAYGSVCLAITGKKPDAGELFEIRSRGDLPFAAATQPLGEKYSDAEWQHQAAAWTATAVLNKKLNTDPGSFDLPDWAVIGYGKFTALKSENSMAKWQAYRTKVKSLVTGKLRGNVTIADAWGATKGKEYDTLVMSVAEYFAFGNDPDQFTKLLKGFQTSDMNTNPTMASVLAGLEWKWEDLDGAWKQFALKAK